MKMMYLYATILLAFFIACSSDKSDETKSQKIEIKKIPTKAVFVFAWSKKTSRYRSSGEAGKESAYGIFRQDPEKIKNNIITRLGDKGYSLVRSLESGTSPDGILHVHYGESVSSVPHWGDTQYQIRIALQDTAENNLLNLGNSRITWTWTDSSLFDYRYLPELVDLAWQRKDMFEFYNQFIIEQRYMTRVMDILSSSKDPRAIDILIPQLRHRVDAIRSNVRKALVKLGFKPKTVKHKASMEIVRLMRGGGQVSRGKQVIFEYGLPAIELYLEDLQIQPGPRYSNDIAKLSWWALGSITKRKYPTWNRLIVDRMVNVLKTGGEGAKTHKESYIQDAIKVLGRIGDGGVIKQIQEYQDHPELGKTAADAIKRIKNNNR
jgi:hypothetical protein